MLLNKVYSLFNSLDKIFKKDEKESSFLLFFRLAISSIAIIRIASLSVDLSLFFSPSDTLIPQELMYLESSYFRYLHPLYNFLEKNNLTIIFYKVVVPIYIFALLFLLLGIFTRYSAAIALILQLIIFRSFSPFNDGYDHFLTMSLFYCFVFPVGKYFSIDNIIFKTSEEVNFNYRRVLQFHLAIAYFFSGIAKALAKGWWNGDSMWKALASVDNSFYMFPPILLTITGITTVLLEFLFPFLVYKKITRKYAITLIILMHIGIAMMMKLYAFSAIMIVWNLAAFGNITIIDKTSDVEKV